MTKHIEKFSGEKSANGPLAENKDSERVTRAGRRTRGEIEKWNQMEALRFQTEGRHRTYPASLGGAT